MKPPPVPGHSTRKQYPYMQGPRPPFIPSMQDDDDAPLWLPRLAGQGGPRFLQIADALQAAVADGSLAPRDCLPPQRLLAARLGVDLTTVTRAYGEARRRHLLEGRGARGSYVAAQKVEWTSVLDLSMNIPPPPEGVDFDDLLTQGLSQVLMRADTELLMTYHLGGGSDADREAAARWLAPMLGDVDARWSLLYQASRSPTGRRPAPVIAARHPSPPETPARSHNTTAPA